MERNIKHLLLRKTDVLKGIYSKRIFEEMHNFKEQKDTRYIQGNVYIGIMVFSCLSSTKACLRSLLSCFVQELKRFYQNSFGNEVELRDIINVSLNILAKNQNFKKLRHAFVDEGAIIKITLMSSCHWKTLAQFCLRKKKSENALLTLTVSYRKIVHKNKLCHSQHQ